MADSMDFPKTWKEFENTFGFNDVNSIYTNGSRLISSFRVEQWLEYINDNSNTANWHTELPSESGDYVVWCCDHMALGPGGDLSKGNRLCIASYNSESKTFVNEYDDEMGILDVKAWWGQMIEPYD